MRRRTFLIGLLLGLMALVLSACSSAAPGPTPTPTRSRPTLTPVPIATPFLIPTIAPPVVEPAAEGDWARVRDAGTLLVGTSLDNPPYDQYDAAFQPDGFDMALIKELARRLGLDVELSDFAFEGLLGALRLKQVDASIAAITVTEERLGVVDFTTPYWTGSDAIVAASQSDIAAIDDFAEAIGKKIGVQSGSVYETFVSRTYVETGLMPREDLFRYARLDDAVRDLGDERVDLVLMDRAPALDLEKQGRAKVVGYSQGPQPFAIAVRKGSTLLPELNRVLAEVQSDGTLANLVEQYLQIPAELVDEIATAVPPATPVPTLPPASTETPFVAWTPTPEPCIDGMAYVADLNYDDRNMTAPPAMQPGQTFQKGWRIRNSGNCDWGANYAFSYTNGNTPAARMGGQDQVIGRTVAPGQTVDVLVDLTAPQAPGTYQGFWYMINSDAVPFGERVWVGIRVPGPPTPTPPPPPPPDADIRFGVDRTSINQGECVNFTWQVTNVRAVYFYPQGQPFEPFGVAGEAGKQECPQATTTYELRVDKRNGEVVTRSIVIYVNPVSGAPVITQFNSSPEWEVVVGQCVQLWWQVQGQVSRVALLLNGAPLWDYAPVSASRQDCPPGPGQVLYELQAWGPGGFVAAQRSINVIPGAPPPPPPPPPVGQPEIRRLSATEQTNAGACVWVSWDYGANVLYARLWKNGALYADNAQVASNIAAFSGNANGDCDTPNPGTITYRLEAFNSAGQSVSREATTQIRPVIQPR